MPAWRRPAIGGVALAVVAALTAVPGAARAAEAGTVVTQDVPNTYAVVGLPQYLTGPTTFTVEVTGTQAVCGMEYGRDVDTAAPWSFTVTPSDSWRSNYVDIALCDGASDWVTAETTVPFEVSRDLFVSGSRPRTLDVENAMDVPAVATLTTRAGRTLAQVPVAPGASATVQLPGRAVPRTTTYRLTMVGDNGVTMTRPVVVAKGWIPLAGPNLADTRVYDQCSTVPWYYDDRREPGNATGMPKDIRLALDVLSRRTNLSFSRVSDPAKAQLTFDWRNLGTHGPSALGGYQTSDGAATGSVTFNTKDWWPTDRYAGIGARHSSPADRGWLVVHEVMHSMGLGHVDDPSSIMAPVNRGQHGFTRGDLEGLRTLYPPGACGS